MQPTIQLPKLLSYPPILACSGPIVLKPHIGFLGLPYKERHPPNLSRIGENLGSVIGTLHSP